jgi:hypothetical protein
MKTNTAILALFLVFCLTSSFQCQNCRTATLRLDKTKSWFPLKGKTELSFLDPAGAVTSFPLKVIDTTETATNDCGDPYKYEYIFTTLYLNQALTDSIHFGLASAGWLCMRAWSNNEPNVDMCNVFGQTKEGKIAQRFYNYKLGSRTYPEAILLLSSPAFTDNIDSIVIANHAGIVGFRYENRNYVLP